MSQHGGVVSTVVSLPTQHLASTAFISQACLGDVGRAAPHSSSSLQGYGGLDGSASAWDRERADHLAIVEALERYSCSMIVPEELLWATARDLGPEGLDLSTVPRCSQRELAHPGCPIGVPETDAPIRWVRGVDLHSGAPVWVPAVMVFLNFPLESPTENFHLQISTGSAAHFDLAAALTGALCEVVERDAIALTWLQRLPLPRLQFDDEAITGVRGSRWGGRRTHLFDATTDVGVPTVYAVDIAPANKAVTTVVGCATAFDLHAAARKVLREVTSCRLALESHGAGRTNVDEFRSAYDGALYMAGAERLHAFEFLLESTTEREPAATTWEPAGQSSVEQLGWLLRRLRDLGMGAVAIELTTRESASIGLRVVRVIVPQLQPMSFSFRARYLGHPRLYEGPPRFGYPAHPEEEMNPWPQPMA